VTIQPTITLVPRIPAKGLVVTITLGDGYAVPTLDAGWQTLTRLRRTSTTDYAGGAPISQTIPFVLDGTAGGAQDSVETPMSRLYTIMLSRTGEFGQPQVFTLRGIPIPLFNRLWVLTDISITSEMRRNTDGLRIQVVGSITILEYVGATIILSPAKKSKAKSSTASSSSSVRYYVVKRGDTLEKIAALEYHQASKWRLIAQANNLRDPNSIKPGQRLKIPKG
jgi:nucleoid-associated protein YgaU